MAQSNNITVNWRVALPWWLNVYFAALRFFHCLGILDVDANVAANFILRHTRIQPIVGTAKVDQKTQRYFERAPLGHYVHPDDLNLDVD